MKTVVFVGGTSYSGSTFFDMILAHDPKGFSCGEVTALFFPYRPHHIHPECGCSNSDCSIWRQVSAHGWAKLYPTIFDRFPNVDFIVDSSKDLFWTAKQERALKKHGIDARYLLIWKEPFESARSFKKRGRLEEFERHWVNYHRRYFASVSDFASVSYRRLTTDPIYLQSVCEYLHIPYFAGKEQYWRKEHHTLFGNTSAKVHLYRDNPTRRARCIDELSEIEPRTTVEARVMSIYRDGGADSELAAWLSQRMTRNPMFSMIQDALEAHDVRNTSHGKAKLTKKVKATSIGVMASRWRSYWRTVAFRVRTAAWMRYR